LLLLWLLLFCLPLLRRTSGPEPAPFKVPDPGGPLFIGVVVLEPEEFRIHSIADRNWSLFCGPALKFIRSPNNSSEACRRSSIIKVTALSWALVNGTAASARTRSTSASHSQRIFRRGCFLGKKNASEKRISGRRTVSFKTPPRIAGILGDSAPCAKSNRCTKNLPKLRDIFRMEVVRVPSSKEGH
jgi:hypothetical protein